MPAAFFRRRDVDRENIRKARLWEASKSLCSGFIFPGFLGVMRRSILRNETLGFNLVAFKCATQIFEPVFANVRKPTHTITNTCIFQDCSLDNCLKKLEEHILFLPE